MLQHRPLSRAGSERGLSEPKPIPWSSSQPGETASTFPNTPQRKTRRRKKKNLLERDYITAASQPVTSPSLGGALEAREPEQRAGALQPHITTQRGMGNRHLPPVQVPHTLFQPLGLAETARALCPSPNTRLPILSGWVLFLL